MRRRDTRPPASERTDGRPPAPGASASIARREPHAGAPTGKKLPYRERRELEELPARIEALESEQRTPGEAVADPGFYKQPANRITESLNRLKEVESELSGLYARWDALDSRPK